MCLLSQRDLKAQSLGGKPHPKGRVPQKKQVTKAYRSQEEFPTHVSHDRCIFITYARKM